MPNEQPPASAMPPTMPPQAGASRDSESAPRSTPALTVPPQPSSRTPNEAAGLTKEQARKIWGGVGIMCVIAALSAALGIGAAQLALGHLPAIFDGGGASAPAALSTPQSEWAQGSLPMLYQADPQWADRPYGTGTVGTEGAAALCLAMVRIEATGDASVGPAEVAAMAQQGGYSDRATSDALLIEGASKLGLVALEVTPDELSVRRQLVGGNPVICTMAPGTFGSEGGCIVLSDIDEHSLLVGCNPASRERSEQHWTFAEVLSQAESLWTYRLAQ